MLISVDLPAPFSPINACTSPARSSSETSSSALMPGKLLLIWCAARRGCGSAVISACAQRDVGRRLDLDPGDAVRQQLDDLYAGARWCDGEELGSYPVVDREVAQVGEVLRQVDDVVERATRGGDGTAQRV